MAFGVTPHEIIHLDRADGLAWSVLAGDQINAFAPAPAVLSFDNPMDIIDIDGHESLLGFILAYIPRAVNEIRDPVSPAERMPAFMEGYAYRKLFFSTLSVM